MSVFAFPEPHDINLNIRVFVCSGMFTFNKPKGTFILGFTETLLFLSQNSIMFHFPELFLSQMSYIINIELQSRGDWRR